MEEEWRPILGADGYEVSSLGRVRTWRKRGGYSRWPEHRQTVPKLLTPRVRDDGYHEYTLSGAGRRTTGHVLVAEAFHGPKPFGLQTRHKNGIRGDNRPENLEYGTAKENAADRARHGTAVRGSKANTSKLRVRDVLAIRRLAASGVTKAELARRYGVTDVAIGSIVRRKNWGWLEDA